MNVMVLKVNAGKAVVIADNGEFMTIPAKVGMKEGAAFEYTLQKKTWNRRAAAIAASFLLCVLGLGALGTFTVSSYIDININPGVRLAVNQWGKVISAEAINEDGGILINEIKSQFLQEPENSVKQVISRAWEDGVLKASGHILLTISDSSIQRAQRTETKLAVSASETVKEAGLSLDITLQKLDIESFRELRKEQEVLDDKSKSDIYSAGQWHSGEGGLFIEKAEYAGGGVIKVVFSGAVPFTGNEIITLEDLSGVQYPAKLKETNGKILLLQCNGLKENSVYKVTFVNIGAEGNTLTSFLFINVLETENDKQNSSQYTENPGDSGNTNETSYDDKDSVKDTPAESPDTDQDKDGSENGDSEVEDDKDENDNGGDEETIDDAHDADIDEDKDDGENEDRDENNDDGDEDNGGESAENDD